VAGRTIRGIEDLFSAGRIAALIQAGRVSLGKGRAWCGDPPAQSSGRRAKHDYHPQQPRQYAPPAGSALPAEAV
jgi:hypothetical protein